MFQKAFRKNVWVLTAYKSMVCGKVCHDFNTKCSIGATLMDLSWHTLSWHTNERGLKHEG